MLAISIRPTPYGESSLPITTAASLARPAKPKRPGARLRKIWNASAASPTNASRQQRQRRAVGRPAATNSSPASPLPLCRSQSTDLSDSRRPRLPLLPRYAARAFKSCRRVTFSRYHQDDISTLPQHGHFRGHSRRYRFHFYFFGAKHRNVSIFSLSLSLSVTGDIAILPRRCSNPCFIQDR